MNNGFLSVIAIRQTVEKQSYNNIKVRSPRPDLEIETRDDGREVIGKKLKRHGVWRFSLKVLKRNFVLDPDVPEEREWNLPALQSSDSRGHYS